MKKQAPKSGNRKQRPLTPAFLGKKGEGHFESIVPDVGLIVNKSSGDDQMGWDYLVEYPYPEYGGGPPLDQRPHPIECKIQIKTIWADGDHVELSLSAAEKLAKSRNPSFVIVFSVDDQKAVTAMHGFHMISDNLARILTRLRVARKNNSLAINKSRLVFNLSDGFKMKPTGDELKGFLERECGADIDEYYQKKMDQQTNLGFSTFRYEMSLTIQAQTEQDVDRVMLGLEDGKLLQLEAAEVRFGIKILAHQETAGSIRILPQPVSKCQLVASGRGGGVPLRINAEIFLPPRSKRTTIPVFKVSNNFMELVFDNGKIEIKNKLLGDDLVRIDDLIKLLKLNMIIFSGKGEIRISVKETDIYGGICDFTEDPAQTEGINQQLKLLDRFRKILEAADSLGNLVRFDDILTSYKEINFLADLIENEKDCSIKPMKFFPEADVEIPDISEGIIVRKFGVGEFAIAYYLVSEIEIDRGRSDIIMSFQNLSLRDVSEIPLDEKAFTNYYDQTRQTTGLNLTLVMTPPEAAEPGS